MIDLIRSLLHHQEWADAALLKAIREHGGASADAELRGTLHHVVAVQRFFLATICNRPFDKQTEFAPPESYDALLRRFEATHREWRELASGLDESRFSQTIPMPRLEADFSLRDVLMQVVMHSQNHRGQCLTRLRVLGAKPPTLDYILWAKDRPADPV